MAANGSGICLVVFDDQQQITTPIRHIANEIFEAFAECVSFIDQQISEDKAVVLITTTIEDNDLQTFESLTAIEAILILSPVPKVIETLPSKILGIYPQADVLLRAFKQIVDTIEIQLIIKSFLYAREKDGNDNINFHYYNLWKNHVKDLNNTKKSFIDQTRLLVRTNHQMKSSIQDFETSYKSADVISWLDKHRHPFPYYNLISHGLRTHNSEILSISRFFLNDLNKQIKSAPNVQVYLGTQLPLTLINELEQQTKNDIIAFQCFLPVKRSRAAALIDATKSSRRQQMANVLFKIDLNNALCVTYNDTIYIDMSTTFQIACVTKNMAAGTGIQLLNIVKLTALDTKDRDQLFEQFIVRQHKLGKTIEDLIQQAGLGVSDEEALADEHIEKGEWSEAVTILSRIRNSSVRILNKQGCLLREYLNDLPGALECHQKALLKAYRREKAETLIYLGLVYNHMKQYDDAFKMYSQALEWLENEKRQDLALIARCLIGLGNIQWARQKFDDALQYAEQALEIREKQIKPKNDFDVAACLGNIGNILHDKGDIERALTYATRAVELLSTCGKGDPRLAAALNNLGAMYQTNGDFPKAREYFERALESLPNENHSHRKSTLANIARLDMLENSTN